METIRIYLDNMFQALPKTSEVLDMKKELLGHMADKYNELKAEGKSENEAIGIVISEFGNIDELMQEMGIHTESMSEEDLNLPVVEVEEAKEFLAVKKTNGKRVGIGVLLILVGVAGMLLLGGFGEIFFGTGRFADMAGVFGVCILLFCVAVSVALFIYSGSMEERFKYLEKQFRVNPAVVKDLTAQYNAFVPTYTLSTVIGVCLIIIAVIPLIASAILEGFGSIGEMVSIICLCILLCAVGISVFIFIYFGNQREAYMTLLQREDYTPDKKGEDKLVSAIGAIVWPITVVCFLIWGFIYDGWGIAWIVFPVVGILFGAFSAVVNIVKHGIK